MHTRFLRLVAVALVALAAFACGGVSNPSTNKTETFMAIVQPGGVPGTHPFTASNSGEISVTITSMNPTFNGFLTIAWLGAGAAGSFRQTNSRWSGRRRSRAPSRKAPTASACSTRVFLCPSSTQFPYRTPNRPITFVPVVVSSFSRTRDRVNVAACTRWSSCFIPGFGGPRSSRASARQWQRSPIARRQPDWDGRIDGAWR